MTQERKRIFQQYQTLCSNTQNEINFEDLLKNEETLCQFIIDPTSLNLPVRVSLADPLVSEFYKLSREFCYIIDKTRIGLLKQLESDKQPQ